MRQHLVLALDAELNRLTSTSKASEIGATPKKTSSRDASSSPVSVVTDLTACTESSCSTDISISSIDGDGGGDRSLAFHATVPDSRIAPATTQSKKRVHFGFVTKRVIPQKPPSKSEKKTMWYTAKDIRRARTEIYALNMACGPRDHELSDKHHAKQDTSIGGSPSDPVPITATPQHPLVVKAGFDEIRNTWRGLEHVRQGALMLKLEHRRNFVKAFLYFTHDLGVTDPGALSVFSSINSHLDRQRAVRLAAQDAMEACKIYYHLLKTENLLQDCKDDRPQFKTAAAADQKLQKERKLWRREPRSGNSKSRHHHNASLKR